MASCCNPHLGMNLRVPQDAGYRVRKLIVAGNASCFAIANNGLRAAVGRNDRRHSAGKRFEHDIAEGVSVRGEDKEIHVGVCLRQRFAAQNTGKLRAMQPLAQPTLLATVTYDEEVKFFVTLVELLLDLRKKCNILLDRESAHKSEHGLAIIGVARPLAG